MYAAALTHQWTYLCSNNVFVIGATNRLDTLDDAVCRTGRMDQFLFVDMPDLQACKAIAKAHLDKVKDGYPYVAALVCYIGHGGVCVCMPV